MCTDGECLMYEDGQRVIYEDQSVTYQDEKCDMRTNDVHHESG